MLLDYNRLSNIVVITVSKLFSLTPVNRSKISCCESDDPLYSKKSGIFFNSAIIGVSCTCGAALGSAGRKIL